MQLSKSISESKSPIYSTAIPPVPPLLMDIAEVKKQKRKKQKLYMYVSPCPSIIHYVSHVCGTLDLQISVAALKKKKKKNQGQTLLKIKKSERLTWRIFSVNNSPYMHKYSYMCVTSMVVLEV